MSLKSPAGGTAITRPGLSPLETAILHTVAYVDVFDYPLTVAELHRYLVAIPAGVARVRDLLTNGRLVPNRLVRCGDFYTLPGRQEIVALRQQRLDYARRLWPWAAYYGRLLASLPFVRLIAVTGSLAVDNAQADADIDYLIVTENGRLWLCRALVIIIIRLAARRGISLCPNYFLAERALLFQQRNLYNAHELVQMVPLAGVDTYRHLRRLNSWTGDYLPNANGFPPGMADRLSPAVALQAWPGRLAETLLRSRLGGRLEQWEMERKIRKFGRQLQAARAGGRHDGDEAAFAADWCKGHFDSHGWRVMEAFEKSCRDLGMRG
jgi:hypothetical protein